MCKDNAVLDVQHLFLEAFVSTNISIVCNCSLYATTHLRLGFNNAQLPEKNCGSIVTIKEPKKTLKYQCRSGTPQQYKHAINNKGYTIQLETGYSRKDISYCFDFYVIEGPGKIWCFQFSDRIHLPYICVKECTKDMLPTFFYFNFVFSYYRVHIAK